MSFNILNRRFLFLKLQELTIHEFIQELASDSPAPGGGSVAALCGALGSALVSMVSRLTLGKEKYRENWGTMEKVQNEGDQLAKNFLALMEEDTDAFNLFMAARKLPKSTDEEKAKRDAAILEASKKTALVPLRTMKACEQLASLARSAVLSGNPNAVTDAGTAALLARSACIAASYNVRINLMGLADADFIKSCQDEIERILEIVENTSKEVTALLENALVG